MININSANFHTTVDSHFPRSWWALKGHQMRWYPLAHLKSPAVLPPKKIKQQLVWCTIGFYEISRDLQGELGKLAATVAWEIGCMHLVNRDRTILPHWSPLSEATSLWFHPSPHACTQVCFQVWRGTWVGISSTLDVWGWYCASIELPLEGEISTFDQLCLIRPSGAPTQATWMGPFPLIEHLLISLSVYSDQIAICTPCLYTGHWGMVLSPANHHLTGSGWPSNCNHNQLPWQQHIHKGVDYMECLPGWTCIWPHERDSNYLQVSGGNELMTSKIQKAG